MLYTYSCLKGNCIKLLLLLQLAGNMLNFQLFIIIGANVVATTVTENINFKTEESKVSNGNGNHNNNNIDDEAFVRFLKYVSQEQNFTTIVVLTNWQYAKATNWSWQQTMDYCVNLKYLSQYFQYHSPTQGGTLIPVILLQSQQFEDYTLHKKFNSEFLTIICIPPYSKGILPYNRVMVGSKVIQNNLLKALSKNLLYLRKNRVIMRMDFANRNDEVNLQNIKEILRYCLVEQILNIIIISYQFPYNDNIYYSYEKYPRFVVRKQLWNRFNRTGQHLFPDKMQNLQGYPLRTLPDQIEP